MTDTAADRPTRFAILLDGDCRPTPRLLGQTGGARAIAADGGIRHAEPLGLAPELWVGDFDSASDAMQTRYGDVPRQRHPARKALSDGELAVMAALERGARSILLCGALGGARSDHLLFHVPLAVRIAARKGIEMTLSSGVEEAVPLLPGVPLRPDLPAGTRFSVIPLSDLSGLTIENAEWPLDAVEVEMGGSLTLSNIAHDRLCLTLEKGAAALVAAFKLW